ncbi:hypothetical protein VZT92_026481 [Zoarces viviparus]|uniref:Uncharacterized protein n=1 Tax=Zoarces viviparus TaxID=48416 RepID=A0AAW1E065_ZOAVI
MNWLLVMRGFRWSTCSPIPVKAGQAGREDWTSPCSRMSSTGLMGPNAVCVCGPNAFTELSMGLLKQQGFSEEELHAFQG